MRFRFAGLVVVAAAAGPSTLAAQANVTVDAGGSTVAFSGASRISGGVLAPSVWWDARGGYAYLGGSFSRYDDQTWTSGVTVGGSAYTSARRPWRLEAGATGMFRAYSGGYETGEVNLIGRFHRAWAGAGAWVGAGYSRTWAWDSTRQSVTGEAGAWARTGGLTLIATVAPRWWADTSHTDLVFSGRFSSGRLQVDATAGIRPAAGATQTWQSVSTMVRLVSPLHFLLTVGKFPDDPIQGFYGGNYVTAGFRFAPRRTPPVLPTATLRRDQAPAPPGPIRRFALERLRGDDYRIVVTVAEGARVEIAGDMTGWAPRDLTASGPGRWETTLSLPRGTHRVNLRVDGGAWVVPPGLPTETDDFDGTVGRLTVP